jgi:hypothetical protein
MVNLYADQRKEDLALNIARKDIPRVSFVQQLNAPCHVAPV